MRPRQHAEEALLLCGKISGVAASSNVNSSENVAVDVRKLVHHVASFAANCDISLCEAVRRRWAERSEVAEKCEVVTAKPENLGPTCPIGITQPRPPYGLWILKVLKEEHAERSSEQYRCILHVDAREKIHTAVSQPILSVESVWAAALGRRKGIQEGSTCTNAVPADSEQIWKKSLARATAKATWNFAMENHVSQTTGPDLSLSISASTPPPPLAKKDSSFHSDADVDLVLSLHSELSVLKGEEKIIWKRFVQVQRILDEVSDRDVVQLLNIEYPPFELEKTVQGIFTCLGPDNFSWERARGEANTVLWRLKALKPSDVNDNICHKLYFICNDLERSSSDELSSCCRCFQMFLRKLVSFCAENSRKLERCQARLRMTIRNFDHEFSALNSSQQGAVKSALQNGETR